MRANRYSRVPFFLVVQLTGILLKTPRKWKSFLLFIADVFFSSMAYVAAVFLSFQDVSASSELFSVFAVLLSVVILPIFFLLLGIYNNVTRFTGAEALIQIILGISIVTGLVYLFHVGVGKPLPLNVLVNYWLFLLLFLPGFRGGIRMIYSRISKRQNAKNVIIYGAGSSGQQLLAALKNSIEYRAVAFVDDAATLNGLNIGGLRVSGFEAIDRLIKKHQVDTILLATPSASLRQKRKILNSLCQLGVIVQSIPGMSDIAAGNLEIGDLQDINIRDILGRECVNPISELFDAHIVNKSVLVSGAGGTIGGEICRQIIALKPKRIVLFELSEFALYKIEQELLKIRVELDAEVEIVPVLGSILKRIRVAAIFASYDVDIIYHAAAYKHVPIVQANIADGVENNAIGTWVLAEEADKAGVKNFVLISTDKAVRPTNVMGASKRMAEMTLQALADNGAKTKFSMVRFGNVLGSSGSVVPHFKEQIKQGGPITVTHPEIIRYFMTVPEAAQLVLQAGAMAEAGDVFVLDMGSPVKIVDLAHKMIRLSGLTVQDENNLDGDVEITFVGLRDGEKLYEELLISGGELKTSHPRILKAREEFLSWQNCKELLVQIKDSCQNNDDKKVQQLLANEPLIGFKQIPMPPKS
ncbi:MAG: hypothetical protein COA47_08975 [Robiginitomaculum sp.]|nr:MAG: hypothetical protein COA47_08975 [Robiginitomaculum sp.]